MTATPTKLRDGSWGARVQGTPSPGDQITITARAGKTWTATVRRVLWSGDGNAIVATESRSSRSARATRSGTYECEECGDYVFPGTTCWETGHRH